MTCNLVLLNIFPNRQNLLLKIKIFYSDFFKSFVLINVLVAFMNLSSPHITS